MATLRQDLGPVTAYAYAVSQGYTGTEEEFAEVLANFADSAEQVAADAAQVALDKGAVHDDKEAVDSAEGRVTSAVNTFTTTTAPNAVTAVENAGTAQIGLVEAEGTRQIGLVADKGTEQVGTVSSEGTTQIGLVEAKGAEVIASIPGDYSTLQGDIASTYSSSSTYAVGDYVLYSGQLYRCTTAISTAEAWTSAKWTAVALGDDVTDLKSAITQMGILHINLFNPETITPGKYLDGNGAPSSNASYFVSDFIDVSNFDKIQLSYTHIAHWYKSDKTDNGAITGMNTLSADAEVTIPANTVYIRFSTANENITKAQVGRFVDRDNYIPYAKFRTPDFVPENNGIQQKLDLLNYTPNGNLFNAHNVIHNYYINPANGKLTYSSINTFGYSPTFVSVIPGESICSNIRAMMAYYDSNLNLLGGFQFDNSKTTTVPDGVFYIQISGNVTDFNTVVVMYGTTATNIGAYAYKLYGLDTSEEIINVDANGGGDYTSLSEAVYNNVDNGKTIIVTPGVYNVKSEYIALFGQSVVDNLADSTSGINNFQYGIRIHDRKIVFEPGSKVVCDWTGKTVDATHRFCAFRVEQGAEIDGLYLDCTATFYAIHDDYGPDTPYTIKYKNCHIEGHDLLNVNCIGGGCHKYSNHIIDNCYFNNHVTNNDLVLSADVRYHNTNTANAEPEIHVSNCYFSNNMNVTYYGNQTTKLRAYVNNCFAPNGVNKVRESSTMNTDNVDLYSWNNQTE